jgi:glycosyltransferase involved in cell wall biosynthesis
VKVIIFSHRLEIGGTQINAIDLATRLRDHHGIEPILFATPGPARDLIDERGLRFEAAPDARFHPSMRRISALRALARREGAELVHAWDWWQCLEAYYGLHLPSGVPMIVTDMMMELTRILPRSILSTFGTPEVLDQAKERGYQRARLLVPPIDIDENSSGASKADEFRARLGLGQDEIVIVTVSRLSRHLKAESLVRTVSATGLIGGDLPVRLVIVGGGEARKELDVEAGRVNEMLGRKAVVFAGELSDPRGAYAAADIVVGMGGSSLRGAAFGKPVVVVGENGFSRPLNPETGEWFYYHGMFGHGNGDPGNKQLSDNLRELAKNCEAREKGGAYAHKFVTEKFSLSHVSGLLAGYYRDAVSEAGGACDIKEVVRTTAIYLRERRFLTPSRDRIVK